MHMIRSLIVTMMTYPPVGGEFLRNWQNINIIRQFGPIGVFSIFNRAISPPTIEGVDFWHHYNTASPYSLRTILEHSNQWLSQQGLTYFCPYLRGVARQLDSILKSFQPDLVVIEQLWLYPYFPIIKQYPCHVVFDSHNVEAPLYESTKCKGSGVRAWARKRFHIPQIKAAENQLTQDVDQVWLCSEDDQRHLQALYNSRSYIHVVPNGVNAAYYECVRQGTLAFPKDVGNGMRNILFLANFAYVPNAEAADLLIATIYPQLKVAYPDCQLMLVGRRPTSAMVRAAQKDAQIIVTGEILDVRPYLAAASIMVVPLRQGSGTRLKILEAFASGCPVVSTTKGAEGLKVKDGEHLLIRNEVDTIGAGILQLWSDSGLQNQLVRKAYELIQSYYSWESVSQNITTAMKDLFPNIVYENQ